MAFVLKKITRVDAACKLRICAILVLNAFANLKLDNCVFNRSLSRLVDDSVFDINRVF